MTEFIKALLVSLLVASFLSLPSQTRKSGTSTPGSRGQDAVNAIGKLEDEMRMAALKGDAGWWADYLTDSYVETDDHGKVSGKSEIIAMHRSPDLVIETLNLSDRNVQTFNGDTVIVTGKMTIAGTYRDHNLSGDYQFTRVWVKLGLEWKLAAAQTAVVTP
ncbi:MAG TPA: nuclear transport factor 2 family protein [Terriglobales bacterium]